MCMCKSKKKGRAGKNPRIPPTKATSKPPFTRPKKKL